MAHQQQRDTSTRPDAARHEVTVVIPTLAETSRREGLMRAIHSVLRQKDIRALPLIVINGKRYDPALRRELERSRDVETIYQDEGHVSKARLFAMEHIRTPFFAFLDDDDVLLDDALEHRLSLMNAGDRPDVVVTNIFVERDGQKHLMSEDILSYAANPRHSIFELGWLNADNNLFRSSTVGPEYFANCEKFMEWTQIAIRLSRTRKISFSDVPTATYHDTPESASKEDAHLFAQARLMASLPRREFNRETKRLIDRKRAAALNVLSLRARQNGQLIRAWRFHLKTLFVPGGWRYLSYTRKLLHPSSSDNPSGQPQYSVRRGPRA